MKITIYELLGLIKDGKAPQKIKYVNSIYELSPEDDDYYSEDEMRWFTNELSCLRILNDEVEIIEDPKKINKIIIDYNSINIDKAFETGTTTFFREKDIEIFQCLSSKINELIDEINNLKER